MKSGGIARTDTGHGNDIGQWITYEMDHPLYIVRVVHALLVALGGNVIIVRRTTCFVKTQYILNKLVRLANVVRREGCHRERAGSTAMSRHQDSTVAFIGTMKSPSRKGSLRRLLKQGQPHIRRSGIVIIGTRRHTQGLHH